MKVLALLGTYHRGGVMDRLADLVLEASRRAGAKVEKIHLSDLDIQYCRNCMVCWERPELKVGKCPIEDDVEPVLRKITRCGALLLGTPINAEPVQGGAGAARENPDAEIGERRRAGTGSGDSHLLWFPLFGVAFR